MIIGFDYWQVLSHYPRQFKWMIERFQGAEVHVMSAIGKSRIGTIEREVRALGVDAELVPSNHIHEVVFKHPAQSPYLKLAKCQELSIDIFFDDRDDVCRLLNKHGILALRVTRKDGSIYDLEAERR